MSLERVIVVVIGDAQVGKTSIVSSLVAESFSARLPAVLQPVLVPPEVTNSLLLAHSNAHSHSHLHTHTHTHTNTNTHTHTSTHAQVTDEKVPLAIIDTSSCDADLKALRILFSHLIFIFAIIKLLKS
jgi:GTPase SAR1 family protein